MQDREVRTARPLYLRPTPPAARLARSTAGWVLGAGIALLVLLTALGTNGLGEYLKLRRQRDDLLRERAALQARTAELEAGLQALRTEPFALEKLARERYNMRRPGEEIILLLPDPGGS